MKKLEPDAPGLMRVIERWRDEAIRAERMITRIILAYEAGRDGFWLARWMRARGVEVHVIHSTSVAVSREHRRAKTDRLDTAMLMRVFLELDRRKPTQAHTSRSHFLRRKRSSAPAQLSPRIRALY